MNRERTDFRTAQTVFLSTILVCIFAVNGLAGSPLWGDLEPGEYGIGFKAVEKFDYSRTLSEKTDYFGAPLDRERARPIQICIWYPANVSTDDLRMTYGEYSFVYPEDERFIDLLAFLQEREVNIIQGMTRQDRGFVLDMLSVELAGVKDATPVEGSFPLVIYHPNSETSYCDNVVLCEYLASHGFVVATTHPLGLSDPTPGVDPVGLETVIGDREFVLAQMYGFPNVNTNSVGMVGFGSGGLSSLLTRMRNSDIDAVVDLGGALTDSSRIDLVKQNPFFNVTKMTVPMLMMYTDAQHQPSMSLTDSLVYSDRYLCKLATTSYMDFFTGGKFLSMIPDSTGATTAPGPVYDAVCQYTMNFLKAYLADDQMAMDFLAAAPSESGLLTIDQLPGEEAPPTQRQFLHIATEYGAQRAYEIFQKFNTIIPGGYQIPEGTFNFFGYQELRENRPEDAVLFFRLNAEAHPNSANCWDSYADGCQAAGDVEEAIRCYQKVLEVIDRDPNASDQLKEQLRNNAEQGLERLQN